VKIRLVAVAAALSFVLLGSSCAVRPDRPALTVAAVSETATATPISDRRPARCRGGEAALEERLARLKGSVVEAMERYQGTWSMTPVDLDCETELSVRPEHVQYPASAGKIVTLIAVLRAVEEGRIALGEIEEQLVNVTTHSLDADANVLNGLVSAGEIQTVLERSRVSERTRFEHDWRQATMPALDLAWIWAALLRGELLGPDWTEYLLGLVTRAQIPPAYETFPAAPDVPGYQFGPEGGLLRR
jgi:hypothetical protein